MIYFVVSDEQSCLCVNNNSLGLSAVNVCLFSGHSVLLVCISVAEFSSPAFDEFLNLIATRVKLKGFESYRGGLDIKCK